MTLITGHRKNLKGSHLQLNRKTVCFETASLDLKIAMWWSPLSKADTLQRSYRRKFVYLQIRHPEFGNAMEATFISNLPRNESPYWGDFKMPENTKSANLRILVLTPHLEIHSIAPSEGFRKFQQKFPCEATRQKLKFSLHRTTHM